MSWSRSLGKLGPSSLKERLYVGCWQKLMQQLCQVPIAQVYWAFTRRVGAFCPLVVHQPVQQHQIEQKRGHRQGLPDFQGFAFEQGAWAYAQFAAIGLLQHQ